MKHHSPEWHLHIASRQQEVAEHLAKLAAECDSDSRKLVLTIEAGRARNLARHHRMRAEQKAGAA